MSVSAREAENVDSEHETAMNSITRRGILGALIAIATLTIAHEALGAEGEAISKVLHAGAAEVDITPSLDVSLGGIAQVLPPAKKVLSPLRARAIVLDDGNTRLALAVCELCLIDTETATRAKVLIRDRFGISEERVMISVAHTHMSPRVAQFGHGPEAAKYRENLPDTIAAVVGKAIEQLQPATFAWGVVQKPEYSVTRRWRLKSPKTAPNPFGGRDQVVHSEGRGQRPAYLSPAGVADPDLSFFAVRTADGCPLALWANFSAHYGKTIAGAISSDYFGHFSDTIATNWNSATETPEAKGKRPVAIMTNGGGGDVGSFATNVEDANRCAEDMAEAVLTAESDLTYRDWIPLAATLKTLPCSIRIPDKTRIAWAEEVLAGRWNGPEHPRTNLYAKQALVLAKWPELIDVRLQVMRLGDLALAATPCEIYGATRLAVKEKSPFKHTAIVDLANGWTGYLIPPDQMPLGGFSTWPQTASPLKAENEPRVRREFLTLLSRLGNR